MTSSCHAAHPASVGAFLRVRGKNSIDGERYRYPGSFEFLRILGYCQQEAVAVGSDLQPSMLFIGYMVRGKKPLDGEHQQSRGTFDFLAIRDVANDDGCFCSARPTFHPLGFFRSCVAKASSTANIGNLEEQVFF